MWDINKIIRLKMYFNINDKMLINLLSILSTQDIKDDVWLLRMKRK